MKILLSGGSGFIGKNLLNFLSQNNENIMVIGRNLNSITINKLNKLKLDLNNPDASYDEIIKYNPDVFVHLAWEGIPDYSEEICRKNYFNTVKLIRMLVNSTSCSKIISTGSCWEYNDGKIIGKCKESETINPSKAFSIYKNKVFQEVSKITKDKQITFNWLRLFYVYGPGQKENSIIPMLVNTFKNNKPINIKYPSNKNDFIYVGDVIRIIGEFISKDCLSGIYNVGTGKGIVIYELLKIIDNAINGNDNLAVEYLKNIDINKKNESFFSCTKKLKKHFNNLEFVNIKDGINKMLKNF